MQNFGTSPTPGTPLEPDMVRQLLVALGQWGVAEMEGASEPALDELEDLAQDAYDNIASVA